MLGAPGLHGTVMPVHNFKFQLFSVVVAAAAKADIEFYSS
jgi:hypothetical protein